MCTVFQSSLNCIRTGLGPGTFPYQEIMKVITACAELDTLYRNIFLFQTQCVLFCTGLKCVCHMILGQPHYCICLLLGEDRVLLLQYKGDMCRPTARNGSKHRCPGKPSQDQLTSTHLTDARETIHNTFKPQNLETVCFGKKTHTTKLTNTKAFYTTLCSVVNTTLMRLYQIKCIMYEFCSRNFYILRSCNL